MQPRFELADIAAAMGVRDSRVLDAMRTVPRAGFVPPHLVSLAGDDEPIPIGHHQVTSQPSLIAAMIEAIDPHDSDVVLEVGTGLGYQTALLANLCRYVWSVEWWPDLAEAAAANLKAAGIVNAEVVTGDGSLGLPAYAPFQGIVVAAAFPSVPSPLVEQLAPGGRVVQPIGPGGDENVVMFVKRDDALIRVRHITMASFVRLVGAHGYPVIDSATRRESRPER
jgi:protein-L-isoaspartate(D-aspartate) O-methyltransferase